MNTKSKWTEDRIKEELSELANQQGKFPTHDDLRAAGRSDLRNAIIRSGIPLAEYAEKLGMEAAQRPRGTWNDIDTQLSTLKKISIGLGHFPSTEELLQSGYGGLRIAMFKTNKPWSWYQEQLGYEVERKDCNFWNEEAITEGLKKFIKDHNLNAMPTFAQLRENNHHDIASAIYKNNKSIHYYAQKLGFIPREKPKGYWNDFENLRKEINNKFQPLLSKNKFPNQRMLQQKGIAPVVVAKHGGINAVAEAMGYQPPTFYKTSDGHFVNSSYEYVMDEYLWSRGIPHEVNDLIPGSNFRYDFKVGDTYIEIWGYENRPDNKRCVEYQKRKAEKEQYYQEARLPFIPFYYSFFCDQSPEEMETELDIIFSDSGFDVTKKEASYNIQNTFKHCKYWTEETVINEAKELVEELGELPGKRKLVELNRGDLADAIQQTFGFPGLRKILDLPVLQQSWSEEKVMEELDEIGKKLGHFPTFVELENMERHDLARAINRRGGINYYRRKFGLEPIREKSGHWNEEKVTEHLVKLMDKLGKFPGWKLIRRHDIRLYYALNNGMNGKLWSGLTHFRNKLVNKV
jgi:hypothetical protein